MGKSINDKEQCVQTDVITRFFVSLVYIKTTAEGTITNLLTIITKNVTNEDEALGYAIKYFTNETKGFSLQNKAVTALKSGYTESEMIESAKYGYEYHATTSFPDKSFEDNCKNNFLQHLSSK